MGIEPLPAPSAPVPLSASLSRLGALLGSARPDALAVVTDQWEQILGTRLAAHCHLASLHRRTLVVATAEPAVAEQLRWAEADLVAAVNAVVGLEAIDAVEVRLTPR